MVLDIQQRAAVFSSYTNTLVVAGAGSGKTRVLVERIAYLVEKKKVSPTEIIALTFTRKAAGELVSRLEARIGRQAHRLPVGTIHALALRFIRIFGEKLGIRARTVTVYGEWEENFLARDTAKLIKAPPLWREMLDAYYRDGLEPSENHRHYRMFATFTDRLRRNNAMTYGMLLINMMRLLPRISERPLSHILVDEVQDLDLLQWAIIRSLQSLRPGCSLFAVGDIDQSIYAFRGAVPEYLLQLDENFLRLKLEKNYRSATGIVSAANRLIECNTRRIPKTMHPHREDPGRLPMVPDMDSAATAGYLKALVEKQRDGIAVLARNHVLLVKLSQELEAIGVPHKYCGGKGKLMQSEEFRRVHAIFRLIFNRYDNFSFDLARPHLGVSDDRHIELMDEATAAGASYVDTWLKGAHDAWRQVFEQGPEWRLANLVAALSRLLQNPDALLAIQIANRFAKTGGNLEGYLDWVTTFDLQEEVADPEEERLQLMTIHAAKGLEFPIVVLIGMNEGLLPSKQSITRGDIEEERRLAYVAMTRAEDQLHILVRPTTTESKGKVYRNPPSRFVAEIKGDRVGRETL